MSAPSAAPFAATTRSRLTSLSLVAGLHLLLIVGLSAGLIRDVVYVTIDPRIDFEARTV